jgi:hypothetical protein
MECYGTVSIFVGEGPVPHLLAEEALNRSRDLVTDILDAFDRFFLP